MSRDGYLPPGCTERECDEAQGGYWDAPQQWFVCDACDGSGVEIFSYWGCEPGCGHRHRMDDEQPCGKCNGDGGWIDDAEPNDLANAPEADGEKLRQLTGEDHGPWANREPERR